MHSPKSWNSWSHGLFRVMTPNIFCTMRYTLGISATREQLFAKDTPVEFVYLLKTGGIYQERISQDDQGHFRITLRHEVRPGELIGHYDLLYSQRHSTRARALEFSSLWAIKANALNRLLYRYPSLRNWIAPLDKIARLRTMPFFGRLDLAALSYVADACQVKSFGVDARIYAAEDPANMLYIVDQGQVGLSWPDGRKQLVGNGMAFGFLDQALPMPSDGRTTQYGHDATATTHTNVFLLTRRNAIEIADLNPERIGHQLRRAREQTINTVGVFNKYPESDRYALIGYMSHYLMPIHHLIMQQGEMGDSLWILMPGGHATLHALEGGQALQPTPVIGPNFFSELALRVEHPLDSTVEAEPGSQWLRLHNQDFQIFLQQHGAHLIDQLTMSPAAERYLGQTHTRQRYAWLQKGEKLVLFRRRHWIVLVRKTIFSFIEFCVFVLLAAVSFYMQWIGPGQIWLVGIIATAGALHFAWGVIDYLNDYVLVTSQRLVRQEQVLFVTESHQAAFLEQIRNVDVNTTFLGNLLQYGHLRVQTAAASGTIDFNFAPDPNTIRRTVLEQQNSRLQQYQASNKMVIQNLLEERLGLWLKMPNRVRRDTQRHGHGELRTWWRKLRLYLILGRKAPPPDADLIVWHKHWFILLAKIIAPATGLLITLLLMLGEHLLPLPLRPYVAPLDILFGLIGLGMLAWLAWNVADWRNDTYEVDNRQIADVEKKPLFFSEQRRTALLGEIENIEVNIPSPLHYFLNFGNVHLQTAATQGDFTFDWVPNPRAVSEEIRRRIEIYRQLQEANRTRQRAQELPDWFEMYSRLGRDGSEQVS